MIVLVIGREGQLARSLAEINLPQMTIITSGRPNVDLLKPESLGPALDAVRPDVVVNAAAYTAVDEAESQTELAFAINGEGPGHLGAVTVSRRIPIIHMSTDYVYDGAKPSPYVENDPVGPLSAYGRSKLVGEQRLAAVNPRHIILRTAWVYAPFGQNFVRTMLRLAGTRREIGVVDDQRGNPTYAPHLAEAIAVIATLIAKAPASVVPWGVYHAVGTGDTTWNGLAREVFKCAAVHGARTPRLEAIATADYPTPAKRPANSRLDTMKLGRTFGVALPHWTQGISECVARLLGPSGAEACTPNAREGSA